MFWRLATPKQRLRLATGHAFPESTRPVRSGSLAIVSSNGIIGTRELNFPACRQAGVFGMSR